MGGRWGGCLRLVTLMLAAPLAVGALSADSGLTLKHEKGRCAIRGHCGSQGFLSPQLPCPDNGRANTPEADVREKLVSICGKQWKDTDVCCEDEQVSFALERNPKTTANTRYSWTHFSPISNAPSRSSLRAWHARTTFSISFARLPAHRTNPSLST